MVNGVLGSIAHFWGEGRPKDTGGAEIAKYAPRVYGGIGSNVPP